MKRCRIRAEDLKKWYVLAYHGDASLLKFSRLSQVLETFGFDGSNLIYIQFCKCRNYGAPCEVWGR